MRVPVPVINGFGVLNCSLQFLVQCVRAGRAWFVYFGASETSVCVFFLFHSGFSLYWVFKDACAIVEHICLAVYSLIVGLTEMSVLILESPAPPSF